MALAVPTLLAACGGADAPPADPAPTVAAATATAPAAETDGSFELRADSRSGEVGIDLPQGAGASIRLPKEVASGMMSSGKVDIGGVGLYPGGKLEGLKVTAGAAEGRKTETVEIGFTAPAAPEAVAQWYAQAFVAQGGTSSRTGNRVLATTSKGASVTIDIAPEGTGSRGTLSVLEPGEG